MSPVPREAFTVRVLRDGSVRSAGVGFVVGDRHIVTCAHVVNTALGREQKSQDKPGAADQIRVEFPMLGDADGAPSRACRVRAWAPPPVSGLSGGDVAGLVLVDEGLPARAGVARLIEAVAMRDTAVQVFGYPGDPPRQERGAWSGLVLRGAVGGGVIQLDVDKDSAIRAQPGYSGSPVVIWDVAGDAVLGMLAIAGRDEVTRDAYAIPVSRLVDAWSEIKHRAQGEVGREAWKNGARKAQVEGAARQRDEQHLQVAGTRSAPRVPQPFILHVDEDMYAVAVSPDGARLATGHWSGARIWNLQTGAAVRKVQADTDRNVMQRWFTRGQPVLAVAFSPDGTRLATGSSDKTARIWDATTGKRQLQVIHGRIAKLAETWVPYMSPAYAKVVQDLIPHRAIRVAFSPDGTRLATWRGNTARIWDATTGKQQARLIHGEPVLAFSGGKTARIWDATTGQQQLRITRAVPVLAVALSPDGTRLVTGGGDKTARIWDATTGKQRRKVTHGEPVLAVALSPDGTRLATGGGNTARIWDAATGKQQLRLTHGELVLAVAFSPDGTRLASCSGNTARIWDATTGQQQLQFAYGDAVLAVVFSPDGTRLVTGGGKTARIWNIAGE
jgi:WD40 repeat protein